MDMPQQQNISDFLKGFIHGARGAGLAAKKREAFALQRTFESAPMSHGAFEQALTEHQPLPFTIMAKRLLLKPDIDDAALLDQIISLLKRYLELAGPVGIEHFGELLSTEEAAAYTGLSVDTIKHHVYRVGDLTGEMKGHSLFFSRKELDSFRAKVQPRGPQNRKPKAVLTES